MKKLTINKTNRIINELSCPNNIFTKTIEIEGEEIVLEVRASLTLPEKSSIIDLVSASCFTSQGYAPEYRDVIFAWKIIDVMTNLVAPATKDKNIDLAKMQDWLNEVDLLCEIEAISPKVKALISNLRSLIDEKLQYQKQLVAHSNNTDELVDAVVSFLDTATKTIEDIGGSLKGLDVSNINELIGKVSKDGVSPDLLKGILDMGSETAPNLEVIK